MTIFKDSHHFSRLWAVFDDNQPSLQQNFRQCLITMFNDSAFFERTLRGRFREKSCYTKTKALTRTTTRVVEP